MYVRNGPNPQFPPQGGYHWFEGDGMLHGVRLRDGKASYRNRWVRTAAWSAEHKAGMALYPSFLDPPSKKVGLGTLPPSNKANTALVWHDGKLLALWEAGEPHVIAVPSLDTVGPHKYDGKLKHPFTAHPKVDPTTGEMFFFGYNVMMKPFVQYSVVDAKGKITRTTPIELPRGVMMHDFAVSQQHTIFMDLPETFSLERAVKGQPPFLFEPKLGARLGVLPRYGEGKEIKWFTIDPCYVFHTLNAYDDGDEVVLLACRMKEFPTGLDFTAAPHPSDNGLGPIGAQPFLYRWRLNLKTGAVKEGPLDDVSTEFPRIHEGLTGTPTRYGYLARAGGELFDGLLKYDLTKGTREQHALGKGRSCGEAVFVPRQAAKTEDDGWLLTFVHDAASGKGELLVVDAREIKGPPVARVHLPARVPFGFHGLWLAGKTLG
jgi:carotenoid cleavage dioxygenase